MKNEKVYPVICAQIRWHAAARKTQDICYSTPFPLGKWRHTLVLDVTNGMSYWVVSFVKRGSGSQCWLPGRLWSSEQEQPSNG